MRQRRILHITPVLSVGGAEEKLFRLVTGISGREYAHHVIYAEAGDFKAKLDGAGVCNTRVSPMTLLHPSSARSIWRMFRYIRANEIDLVHCHLDIAFLMGGVAALAAGVPLLFSFQSMGDERFLGHYRVFRWLDTAVARHTDRILVESEGVKSVLRSWGVGEEKLTVVPNGVAVPHDPVAFREESRSTRERLGPAGAKLVGNMARLVDFKNHKLLLAAAAQVIGKSPDVRFVIVGDGPLRSELQSACVRLGIEKNVLFLGTIMDFESYVASFDIFVLSSHTESSPMALLHALALGLPVISTAVGDIPSVLRDGVDGLLVPPDDASAMAGAILRLLDDRDLRQKLARSAWETAKQRYSDEAMLRGTRAVYEEVLGGRA